MSDTNTIAVDLGGTRFRVAVIGEHGEILERSAESTHAERGREDVMRRITSAIRRAIQSVPAGSIAAIGIGVPGPVNPKTGIVSSPPNLPGWDDAHIKTDLEQVIGLPVFVGNDANLAALGEFYYGAGKGSDDMVYLTISTGVGGGIISDSQLLVGAHGLAGEIGHMIIRPDGPACGCGKNGCLESIASGPAIAREAVTRIQAGSGSMIWQMTGGELDKVTAETVIEAARSGDVLANAVLCDAFDVLGMAMANLAHILDPEMFVIGGGVSNAGDLLFEPARRSYQANLMTGFKVRAQIVPAALGDNAGLIGAGILARQKALSH